MSDEAKVTPSLESLTIRAKYKVPFSDFEPVKDYLKSELDPDWSALWEIGDSVELHSLDLKKDEKWNDAVKKKRYGFPMSLTVTALEHETDTLLLDVECRPVMWYRIASFGEADFSENEIQEALLECRKFVRQAMSGLKGREIEPVSIYPVIQRTEIRNRLLNLGLVETVDHLDKAERYITQNDFEASLKSSRTAFEKIVDWQMKKRGLEQTNNYKNDLERIRSKGYLDKETTELLQIYYRCLSNIAVHAKGEVEPSIYEAQMGYRMTLVMADYLISKLP